MNFLKSSDRTGKVLIYMILAATIEGSGSDDDTLIQLCNNLFQRYVKKDTELDLCDYDYLLTEYCQCSIKGENRRCIAYSLLSSRFLIKDKLCIEVLKIDQQRGVDDGSTSKFLEYRDAVEERFWANTRTHACKFNLNTKSPIMYHSFYIVLSYVLFGNKHNVEFLRVCTADAKEEQVITYMQEKLDIRIQIQPHDTIIERVEGDLETVYIAKRNDDYGYYTTPHHRRILSTKKEIKDYIKEIEKLAKGEIDKGNVLAENQYVRSGDDIRCLLCTNSKGVETPIINMKEYAIGETDVLGDVNTLLIVSGYVNEVSTSCSINDTNTKDFEICNDKYTYFFVVHGKLNIIYYTSWDNKNLKKNSVYDKFGLGGNLEKITYLTESTREKELVIIKLAAIFCRYVKRECYKDDVYPFGNFYLNFNLKGDEAYSNENVIPPIKKIFGLPFESEKNSRTKYNDSKKSVEAKGIEYMSDIVKIFNVYHSDLSILRGANKRFLIKFPSTYTIVCKDYRWQNEYSLVIQLLERGAMWMTYEDILLRSFMFIDLIKDDVTVVNSAEMTLRKGNEWVNKFLICILEFTQTHWGVLFGVRGKGMFQYDDMGWDTDRRWGKAIAFLGADAGSSGVTILKTLKGDGTNCGVTVSLAIKLFCVHFEDENAEFDDFQDFFNRGFQMESWATYGKRLNIFLKQILKYKDGIAKAYGDITVDEDCIKFRNGEIKMLGAEPSSAKQGTKSIDQLIKDLKLSERSDQMKVNFPTVFDQIFAQYNQDGDEDKFRIGYNDTLAAIRGLFTWYAELKRMNDVGDVIHALWKNRSISAKQYEKNDDDHKQELQEIFDRWKGGDIDRFSQFIEEVCKVLV